MSGQTLAAGHRIAGTVGRTDFFEIFRSGFYLLHSRNTGLGQNRTCRRHSHFIRHQYTYILVAVDADITDTHRLIGSVEKIGIGIRLELVQKGIQTADIIAYQMGAVRGIGKIAGTGAAVRRVGQIHIQRQFRSTNHGIFQIGSIHNESFLAVLTAVGIDLIEETLGFAVAPAGIGNSDLDSSCCRLCLCRNSNYHCTHHQQQGNQPAKAALYYLCVHIQHILSFSFIPLYHTS